MSLTQARLKELLTYDPVSGVFARIKPVKGNRPGKLGRINDGYLLIGIDRNSYAAHRLAWLYIHGKWPAGMLDHRNGVRLDNRIDNLRDASYEVNAQNLQHAKRNSDSGVLGVGFDRVNRKWRAKITIHKRTVCLGRYPSMEAASSAYIAAKRKYHEGCML